METWRQELYHSLKHSVEGSEWKDHKYIAIVDGKYIYPEDVKNGSKSPAATSSAPITNTTSTTGSSKVIPPTTPKKVKKQKDKSGKDIDVTDKGSVASYKDLPTDAQVGDMYLLEDTKRYCYWDGEKWTSIDESQEAAAVAPVGGVESGGGSGGGSGRGKEESGANNGLSKATLDKAREAVKKLTSGKASSTKKAQVDTHQKSWDQRKAAGKLPASGKLTSSKTVSSGKKSMNNSLKSLVSKALSSLSKSNISAGAKIVSRFRGAQR